MTTEETTMSETKSKLEVRVVRAVFISLAAAIWATGWFLGDPASVIAGAAGMLCVYGALDATVELRRRRR